MPSVNALPVEVPFPRHEPSALFAELPSQHRVTKIRKYLVGIFKANSFQRRRAFKDPHILLDLSSRLYYRPKLPIYFRPCDIRWSETDNTVSVNRAERFLVPTDVEQTVFQQLRTVIQTAGHVKEYMRIFERAPALKAVGLEDTYKVLADFGDAVLAGQLGKKGARFVTWEWDFDRQGVHAGHYFMENYEAAKQDFAVRAGLVERQRLFSDEQLAVIRNACAFALEDDATLSYAEEKQLQRVQEQIELLLPQQERNQHPTMEQTM